ncbi:MAG: DUF1178 family protein [Pseudomonadota bacterium]
MIRYAMRCDRGHCFDSWFRDSAAFESLSAAGQLACADCGSTAVEKLPMAPAVARGNGSARRGDGAGQGPQVPAPTRPAPPAHAAPPAGGEGRRADLAELRRRIEAVSDDVGRDFAAEARRIHAGEAPERPILGEASLAEARDLAADDIPVMPLPWWTKQNG